MSFPPKVGGGCGWANYLYSQLIANKENHIKKKYRIHMPLHAFYIYDDVASSIISNSTQSMHFELCACNIIIRLKRKNHATAFTAQINPHTLRQMKSPWLLSLDGMIRCHFSLAMDHHGTTSKYMANKIHKS